MNPGIAGGVSGARRLTFYAGIVHSSWLYGMSNQHSSCDLRTSVHRNRYTTIDFTRELSVSLMDYGSMLVRSFSYESGQSRGLGIRRLPTPLLYYVSSLL